MKQHQDAAANVPSFTEKVHTSYDIAICMLRSLSQNEDWGAAEEGTGDQDIEAKPWDTGVLGISSPQTLFSEKDDGIYIVDKNWKADNETD